MKGHFASHVHLQLLVGIVLHAIIHQIQLSNHFVTKVINQAFALVIKVIKKT